MPWSRTATAAALPVAAVAVFAAIQSYSHIEGLALGQHQSLTDARLLPLSVDFLIVAGSVILLAGSRLGWLCVVPGVVATLLANVATGLPFGPLAATVAGWPAIAFVTASFALERWLRSQVGESARFSNAEATALVDGTVDQVDPVVASAVTAVPAELNGNGAVSTWSAAPVSGWS